jgi:drug/metabolite transporter (DMT)-like permease
MTRETRGLLLGIVGVLIFSATLPFTRMAVGSADAPLLSPWFVAIGRAAIAGLLAALVLLITQPLKPARSDLGLLAITSAGVVFGFPLLTTWAIRYLPSAHGAVITGLLPLVTALFAAMIAAPLGYSTGAKLSVKLGAVNTICWVLVFSLPITLPGSVWLWPVNAGAIALSSWLGFAYVSVFSMFLGFFAWYNGLIQGGVARVSQTQLLQPFLTLLLGMPLLGERLTVTTLAFAVAVVAIVFIGRKMPIQRHP